MLSTFVLYVIASSSLTFAAVCPPLEGRQTVWPELDAAPPTDSPQVQEWISQIDFSSVPQIATTTAATCDANTDPVQVEQAELNCWWTCNLCIREADVSICPTKGDWGLTFDDGPAPETVELLDNLLTDNTKATFFVIGSQVRRYPEIMRRIVDEGHEVAVHTWSHTALTTQTNEQIVAELGWTRKAIADIVGANVPITLMRPPYGDIDDRVRAVSQQMDLVPALWTSGFDTNDWKTDDGSESEAALEADFETLLRNAAARDTGFITLQHTSSANTTRFALDVVLPRARKDGWKLRSLAQCGAV